MTDTQLTRKIVDDLAQGRPSSMVHYLLIGEHGTVEVLLDKPDDSDQGWFPETGGWRGLGVGYHAPFPYETDQAPQGDECEFVPGGRCYFALNYRGEDLVQRWWNAGRDDEVIWRHAEGLYRGFFLDMTPEDHLLDRAEVLGKVLEKVRGRADAIVSDVMSEVYAEMRAEAKAKQPGERS